MSTTLSAELLIDNSAWARLDDPGLPQPRVEEIADRLEQGHIAVCLPFLLEAGYSARTAADHDALLDELLALPLMSIDRDVERRALDAQAQLARVRHHRLRQLICSSQRSPMSTGSGSCTTTATTTSSTPGPTSRSTASGSSNAAAFDPSASAQANPSL